MKLKIVVLSLILLFTPVALAAPDGAVSVTPPAAVTAPAAASEAAPAASVEVGAPVVVSTEKPAEEAPAASEGVQKWWQAVLVLVIEFVAAVASPVLVVLIVGLLRKWKINVELETVRKIVKSAVGYGEQKGKVAFKAGKPLEGPEIFKISFEQGEKLLKKYNLYSKFGTYLADLIESELGEQVANAGGRNTATPATPETTETPA